MTAPVRPTDVSVTYPNGERVLCELVYGGEEDGCHVWLAVSPVPVGATIDVGSMPPHSAVAFPRPEETL